jgi:hypothetical protein
VTFAAATVTSPAPPRRMAWDRRVEQPHKVAPPPPSGPGAPSPKASSDDLLVRSPEEVYRAPDRALRGLTAAAAATRLAGLTIYDWSILFEFRYVLLAADEARKAAVRRHHKSRNLTATRGRVR